MHNKKIIAIGLIALFATITAAIGITGNLEFKIIFLLGIVLFIATFIAIKFLAFLAVKITAIKIFTIKTAAFEKIIHVINNFYLLTGSINTWAWDTMIIIVVFVIVPSLTIIPYQLRVFIVASTGIYAGASLILWSSFIYRNFFKKRDPTAIEAKKKLLKILKKLAAEAKEAETKTAEKAQEKLSKFLHDLTAEESNVKPTEPMGNK